MLEQIAYILIAAGAATGLYLQSGIPQGKPRRHMFVFYTNQSNAIIAVYHILLLVGSFSPEGGLYQALSNATVRFSLTLMIWVTHIIYHFVLVPHFKRHREKYEDNRHTFGNLCVHYLVPLATLLEWALWADKGVTLLSCVIWLLIPVAYLIYCVLRAAICGPIGSGTARYPYAFMDLDLLGPKKWVRNLVLVLGFYFLLALTLLGAARILENL